MLAPESKNEEYSDGESAGIRDHSHLSKAKAETEKYRQEIYELRRKLELNEAMLRETQEANESLEESLKQALCQRTKTVQELEEKRRVREKEFQVTIANLETELTKHITENEQLRQQLLERCQKIGEPVEMDNSKLISDRSDASIQSDDITIENRPAIAELLFSLREEEERREQAEERARKLKIRCDELEHGLQDTNETVAEKTRTLEQVREELATMRIGAQQQFHDYDSHRDSSKGNSLFAEVEDRRKTALDKMRILREKYAEVKRECKAKAAEIKMLQTERASTLKQWESDTNVSMAENEELMAKYKSRILELEDKLKLEIKKNTKSTQFLSTDSSFEYIQSLLTEKRKEIEDLQMKLEDLRSRSILQEEAKFNVTKQLQYWKKKATTLEIQLSISEARPESTNAKNPDGETLPENAAGASSSKNR